MYARQIQRTKRIRLLIDQVLEILSGTGTLEASSIAMSTKTNRLSLKGGGQHFSCTTRHD